MQTQTTRSQTASWQKSLWKMTDRLFGGLFILIGLLGIDRSDASAFEVPPATLQYDQGQLAEIVYYDPHGEEGPEGPIPPIVND